MTRTWLPLASGLIFVLASAAAEPGIQAQFVGGTLSAFPAKSKARLDLTSPEGLVFRSAKAELRIAYPKIESLEYGQSVSRRYAAAVLISPMLLLSKSHKHFVTIGYLDTDGNQQALVFRLEKGDIRSALASLEARSGRRVEFQDDDARKAGK